MNRRSLSVATSPVCSLHHVFNMSEVIGALGTGELPNNIFFAPNTMAGKLWPVGSGNQRVKKARACDLT